VSVLGVVVVVVTAEVLVAGNFAAVAEIAVVFAGEVVAI
jgi:hypothetical protein